ncbi:hypothetical protein WDZ17_00075 [Pseudokineococcus basanitobsidens]|uniref:Uncharacterized protein n=1 Tax=Pseudokineococcus basanitobsidens TaxID=1926649 RepID=A0ABU8RF03_9ACTN
MVAQSAGPAGLPEWDGEFLVGEPDRIPIFLSHPDPNTDAQREFLQELGRLLMHRGLHPRTLGRTDYDVQEPLAGTYGVMAQCYGVFTVAFAKHRVNGPDGAHNVSSPWMHIETAMAYGLGLPVAVLREEGVLAEGVLEKGVAGVYLGSFPLDVSPVETLSHPRSSGYIDAWTGQVRETVRFKSRPPRHYR